MSENPLGPVERIDPATLAMAQNIAMKVENMLSETYILAQTLSVQLTLSSILSSVLATGWTSTSRPITKDEWDQIYDYVEGLMKMDGKAGPVDMGEGPEATGTSASRREAAARADHWGEKISSAAFDLPTIDDTLAAFESQFAGESEDGDE